MGSHGTGHGDHTSSSHGHGHQTVSPVMYTVAVLLVAFLLGDVGLLYLLNWPDADIRLSVYRMLSSTMSIFLAVTLNVAIFSFLLEQVLPSPFPKGLNIEVSPGIEFVVGFTILCVNIVLLNVLSFVWRDPENEQFTDILQILLSHLTAFAGIITFGTLQVQADSAGANNFLFVGAVWVVIFLLRGSSGVLRDCFLTETTRCGALKLGQEDEDEEIVLLSARSDGSDASCDGCAICPHPRES